MSETTIAAPPSATPNRPMTYGEAVEKLANVSRIIRDYEGRYAEALDTAADAESLYRKELGRAFDTHRDAGLSVDHATSKARAECHVLSRERDRAAGAVKHLAECLENRRGERESFNRFVALSHSVDIREGG